jgi:hypothetical protein
MARFRLDKSGKPFVGYLPTHAVQAQQNMLFFWP